MAMQPSESVSPGPTSPLAQAGQPTPPQPSTDPLDNGPWLKLVENCVDLFDELNSHLDHFDPSGREVAEHTCLRLQDVLESIADRLGISGADHAVVHAPRPDARS